MFYQLTLITLKPFFLNICSIAKISFLFAIFHEIFNLFLNFNFKKCFVDKKQIGANSKFKIFSNGILILKSPFVLLDPSPCWDKLVASNVILLPHPAYRVDHVVP